MSSPAIAQEIKEHPSLTGYGASKDGRVWSRYVQGGGLRETWQQPLSPAPDHNGYLLVNLFRKTTRVHRFVLECWVGPCPPGMECRHIDGDPSNNALDNLEWATHIANEDDKVLHGTLACGERSGKAKLTEADVLAIRADPRRQVDIAADYGISQGQVSSIKTRGSWNCVGQ